MDEIVNDFLIESGENLDRLDQELVQLESDPSSKELLGSIFRTIHTIKGSCGFLGFARLEKVAHTGENLLSRLREGDLALTEGLTNGLLAMVDAVRRMLTDIRVTEHDGENDYVELLEHLKALQASNAGKLAEALAPGGGAGEGAAEQALVPPGTQDFFSQDNPLDDPAEVATAAPQFLATEPVRQEPEPRDARPPVAAAAPWLAKVEDPVAAPLGSESRGRETVTETVRIGVILLDQLMNLVGELVLARNQLLQCSLRTQDVGLQMVSQRMNLIATELQGQVMKTRMQPIGNIWNKFPRTVRDLALSCGKEVRVEMEGQDTELDRTIIEAIKDPLTHLVRNSVDHGIEVPEDRVRAGKERSGILKLRAFHEGGQVNIEISDDGGGLKSANIRTKAIERGLITAKQAEQMPERELFNLIFLPGFSTAAKVTNVSGRGVGMDVVKTNVEKIGGTVDVQSTPGVGTTVRVKIPLTLAIIPALVVTCYGERFAIPQVSLTELVRLEGREKIEEVRGAPVLRLRGRLLPLVYLSRELQLTAEVGRSVEDEAITNIVVLQADDRAFGLVVDAITDTQEIVVKPLGKQLKGISAYSGATIMGDGRVALILDVFGLAQNAKLTSEAREASGKRDRAVPSAPGEAKQTFLIFAAGGARMAVPLEAIARLEELRPAQIERAGYHSVVQYRGGILPMISLEHVLDERKRHEQQSFVAAEAADLLLQVLVCNFQGNPVGLVVENIVDIVEEAVSVRYPATRDGVLCSAVIGGLVTEIIDIPAVLRAAKMSFAPPGTADTMQMAAEAAG